ncbi:MAG TPA: TraB/GumN family protein, partial [Rhizomicrobium sp.]|nr:TraB/GumN family protein [Rhizomicrobium sp.]
MTFRPILAFVFSLIFSLFGLLVSPVAAVAQAQPALSPFQAFPSLWHIKGDPIKGDRGEVYLLGAVHVLPANLHWRTPGIGRALSRSDVLVFEVPQDETALAQLNGLIQAQGFLP